MRILIVGLGLIGASYAMGLKAKGHKIYGVARSKETVLKAKERHIVDQASTDFKDFIDKSDVIIICLYPKAILPMIKEMQPYFRRGQLVTDVCGIKSSICQEANILAKPATFVGHHPMAGREKVGIDYASDKIFEKANFLITPTGNYKENDIVTLKQIAYDLGFGKVHIISPEHHDKLIAYTSQLTHAIAVSLVNADSDTDTASFIGDSYRDLTRIAKINGSLWSELFLNNTDNLVAEIEAFESELNSLKTALVSEDTNSLLEIFERSTRKRSALDEKDFS